MQRKRGFVMPFDGSDDVWEYAECGNVPALVSCSDISSLCTISRIRPLGKLHMKTNGYHLRRKQMWYFHFSFTFIITGNGLLNMSQEFWLSYC
jgi:hypothetical protein